MKTPILTLIAALCLSGCTASAESPDEARLRVLARLSYDIPPDLELIRLETQEKDAAFQNALLDVMQARNDLGALKVKGSRETGALLKRMKAEREMNRVVRESQDLSAKAQELTKICSEIFTLRKELTASKAKRVHEIALLREEAAALRKRMPQDRLQDLFDAETQSLILEAADVQVSIRRTSNEIAAAKALRDRLKALARAE
jgi:hypothetical protein